MPKRAEGITNLSGNELSYFSENYVESKKKFLEIAPEATRRFQHRIEVAEEPSIKDGLTIDTLVFDAAKEKDTLLMLISGTHGIELGVGAAIQQMVGHEFLEKRNENTGVVMIHALNPYGAYAGRKMNENRVDLIRAFVNDTKELKIDDSELKHIQKKSQWVFSPQRKRLPWLVESVIFSAGISSLVPLVYTYSYRKCITAIAGGQYENSKGLSFGGNNEIGIQPSVTHYKNILQEATKGYKKLVMYDFHSGLGQCYSFIPLIDYLITGEDMEVMRHIFPKIGEMTSMKAPQNMRKRRMRNKIRSCINLANDIFFNVQTDNRPEMYRTNGGIDEFTVKHSLADKTYCASIDFGVKNIASVIHTQVAENQVYNHGAISPGVAEKVRR